MTRRAWMGGVTATAIVAAAAAHRAWLPALQDRIARAVEPTPLDRLLATLSPTPDIAIRADVDGVGSAAPGVLVTIENLGDAWLAFAERQYLRIDAWNDLLIMANVYPVARSGRGESYPIMSPHYLIGAGQQLRVHYELPRKVHAYILGTSGASTRELTHALYVTEIAEMADVAHVEMFPNGVVYPHVARLPSRLVGTWFDLPRPIGPHPWDGSWHSDRIEAPPAPPMPIATVPYYNRMKELRRRQSRP